MKRVVIIVCQRSGTNIAAKIYAHDNNLPLYNERDLGHSSCALTFESHAVLIEFMNNKDEFVLQAPSLSVYCDQLHHWLDESVKIIWVDRNSEEIRKSRERVDWPGEEKEAAKYMKEFGWLIDHYHCFDSVDMAKRTFQEYQSKLITHEVIEYNSLKNHELWKDERAAIRIGET